MPQNTVRCCQLCLKAVFLKIGKVKKPLNFVYHFQIMSESEEYASEDRKRKISKTAKLNRSYDQQSDDKEDDSIAR